MEQDVKAPSEQAKRKACELTNAYVPPGMVKWGASDVRKSDSTAPLYALALHLDEVDRVAREVMRSIGTRPVHEYGPSIRSLMLPDLPDPRQQVRDYLAGFTTEMQDCFFEAIDSLGYKLVKDQ